MKKVNMGKGYNVYTLSNGIRVSVLRCRSVMVYRDADDKVVHGFEFNGDFITIPDLFPHKTTLQQLLDAVK